MSDTPTETADDIVQELLDWQHIIDRVQGKAVVMMLSGTVFGDAADEIERLQAELAAWQATVRAHDALAAERADEIERLRAAGDALAEGLRRILDGIGEVTEEDDLLAAWQEARRG